MRCKYFFILVIVFSFIFAIPKVYAAENLTGAWTMYHKTTFHSVLTPGYDTTSSGISFPNSSYTQISAANLTDGAYSVVTQMQLAPSYTFVRGNDYTMNYHFDFGSYIYPYWPNSSSQSWFFQSCPGSNCNLSYVWQGDSSHQQTSSLDLTISFRATSDSNSATFTIGNTTDDKGTFYNAFTSQQGIRISSANITEVSNQIDLNPIIDNQNQNTQDIINNQNDNTSKAIDSMKVCNFIDKNFVVDTGKRLSIAGVVSDYSSMGITSYISINSTSELIVNATTQDAVGLCFYNVNKELISCLNESSFSLNDSLTIPSSSSYFRATIRIASNIPTFKLCSNGNQALHDFLNDDDIGATVGSDFTSNFVFYDDDNFSTIITSPLVFLHSLSDTCTPITLNLFLHDITLPCGTTVFWERNLPYVDSFRGFWNILFGGLIIYRLTLTLIMHVNDALDPTKDKIGGLDI